MTYNQYMRHATEIVGYVHTDECIELCPDCEVEYMEDNKEEGIPIFLYDEQENDDRTCDWCKARLFEDD
jgi:hypothetical protein